MEAVYIKTLARAVRGLKPNKRGATHDRLYRWAQRWLKSEGAVLRLSNYNGRYLPLSVYSDVPEYKTYGVEVPFVFPHETIVVRSRNGVDIKDKTQLIWAIPHWDHALNQSKLIISRFAR